MNELVSVVVPIYKVEKYLKRCVDSILNQTYSHLEVILVDDGSPDLCPQICDAYAQQDSRIRVVHKENQGLGMARNTGIDHATGDYICFFDSDDYIAPDTIAVTLAAAREYQADLVIFGHDDVTPQGNVLDTHIPCPPKPLFSGQEIAEVLLPTSLYSNMKTGADWKVPLCAWNKLYAMDVIRRTGWRFVSEREIISEDFYSLTQLHGFLNRVCIVDRVFYHYTVNNSSLSRSYRPDRFERIKIFGQEMLLLSEKMGLRSNLEQAMNTVTFGLTIGALKMLAASDLPFKQRYAAMNLIVTDPYLRKLAKAVLSDRSNWQKRVLCFAVCYKLTWLCFALVSLKNKQGN